MSINSREYQIASHSNELEHRITRVEVQVETHAVKISYFERAVQGLIYALAVLATSKSGDVVDLVLQLARAKI